MFGRQPSETTFDQRLSPEVAYARATASQGGETQRNRQKSLFGRIVPSLLNRQTWVFGFPPFFTNRPGFTLEILGISELSSFHGSTRPRPPRMGPSTH